MLLRAYRPFYSISGIVMIAICSACTPPTSVPRIPQRNSAIINASKDAIWPKIIAEVGLEYPVQALEKSSGLITTQFVNLPVSFNNGNMERWAYKPSVFLGTWEGLRMNMRILAVEIEPGKTQVTIKCHYEAFESNVSKSWMVSETTGALENGILSKLEQNL